MERMLLTLGLGVSDFIPYVGWVPPLVLIANHFGIGHIGPISIPHLTPDLAHRRGSGAARAVRIAYDIVRTGGELFTQGTFPSIAVDPDIWTQILDHDLPGLEKLYEEELADYQKGEPELRRAAAIFGIKLAPVSIYQKST